MADNGINNVAIVNKSNGVRNLLRVNIDIPYDLIAKEVEESTGLKNELTQISALYDIYKSSISISFFLLPMLNQMMIIYHQT